MSLKHLISCQDLEVEWLIDLFQRARELDPHRKVLNGLKIATLFYEDSTRTRISFELAGANLGAQIVSLNPRQMSLNKGESLLDTAQTLEGLGVNMIILRHPDSGLPARLASDLKGVGSSLTLINAGDGMREHPSQALLDLYTLLEAFGSIQDKRVLIVGDCLHSRVAKSNIHLLPKFGAQITLSGPPTLVPYCFEGMGLKVEHDLDRALAGQDAIIVLRLQQERQKAGLIASLKDYSHGYKVTKARLERAGLNLSRLGILHPGPVNRGIELEAQLIDHPGLSLILRQVQNGLKVRMAILLKLWPVE